jgi:hypothetical protein
MLLGTLGIALIVFLFWLIFSSVHRSVSKIIHAIETCDESYFDSEEDNSRY